MIRMSNAGWGSLAGDNVFSESVLLDPFLR